MEQDIPSVPKKFWQTVQQLRMGMRNPVRMVFRVGGELLTSTDSIVGQWKEYFQDLTSIPPTCILKRRQSQRTLSWALPSLGLRPLNNSAAAAHQGSDEIRSKLLNPLDVVGPSWLTCPCNILWTLRTVPLERQTGVVVPLFKKGDWRVCSNYRGSHSSASPGRSSPGAGEESPAAG